MRVSGSRGRRSALGCRTPTTEHHDRCHSHEQRNQESLAALASTPSCVSLTVDPVLGLVDEVRQRMNRGSRRVAGDVAYCSGHISYRFAHVGSKSISAGDARVCWRDGLSPLRGNVRTQRLSVSWFPGQPRSKRARSKLSPVVIRPVAIRPGAIRPGAIRADGDGR